MYLGVGMSEDKDKNKDKNEVNDPGVSYGEGKNRIVFFKSFEEENEYTAKKNAEKDPIEGLKETVGLIIRIYGFTPETLRARKSSDEIIIGD